MTRVDEMFGRTIKLFREGKLKWWPTNLLWQFIHMKPICQWQRLQCHRLECELEIFLLIFHQRRQCFYSSHKKNNQTQHKNIKIILYTKVKIQNFYWMHRAFQTDFVILHFIGEPVCSSRRGYQHKIMVQRRWWNTQVGRSITCYEKAITAVHLLVIISWRWSGVG